MKTAGTQAASRQNKCLSRSGSKPRLTSVAAPVSQVAEAVAQQAEEVRQAGGMSEAEVADFLDLYDRELVGYTYLEAV